LAPHHLIGEILCDMGYLNRGQLVEGRRVQMSKPEVYLGEHLVNMGFITIQQLNEGLQKQLEEERRGP
jgi:hypothetical protein